MTTDVSDTINAEFKRILKNKNKINEESIKKPLKVVGQGQEIGM